MDEDRKYKRQRSRLVDELFNKGITNERVLKAMAAVPRHLFIDLALRNRAYEDEALPIGLNQTISQPFTVAYQTALLDPQKDERILEIGTGSGYQAAILCEMEARVFSIERHKLLLDRTLNLIEELGYRVVAKNGDGTLGWLSFAPYDGIIVTAGASEVPKALLAQLRVPEAQGKRGGRLVIPIGDQKGQAMNRIVCLGQDVYQREELHTFRFVPLIGEGGGSLADV